MITTPKRKSIWKKVILSIAIIFVSTAIGGWIGNLVTPDAKTAAGKTDWSTLGFPPSGAVAILGEAPCVDQYEVVVGSASGTNYINCQTGWQKWDNPPDSAGSPAKCQGDPPSAYSPGFDRLPFSVKDCVMQFSNEWNISEKVYTVLEDGSVWHWSFTYGMSTVLGYLFGGLLIGLVAGIAISILAWLKRG
jgi:ABC-type antimicrobial peptide transport system permease subunit